MKILEKVNYLVNKELQKTATTRKTALAWFITETIQIISIIMGGVMLLWLYAPYDTYTKIGITTLVTIITYDVFKNFVYVRWILWKDNQ